MSTDFASIAIDVAAWLSDHTREDLPEFAAITINHDRSDESVEIQMWSRNALSSLVAWAEHLQTDVRFALGHNGEYVRTEIRTSTRQGISIELWTHLSQRQWGVLQTIADVRFDHTPRAIPAETLRQAAAALGETPGGEAS